MKTLIWAWMKRSAWAPIAAATFGWACPVELTAMPAAKSRYSSPLTVVTRHPLPCVTCRSVTLNHTFDKCDMQQDYDIAFEARCDDDLRLTSPRDAHT